VEDVVGTVVLNDGNELMLETTGEDVVPETTKPGENDGEGDEFVPENPNKGIEFVWVVADVIGVDGKAKDGVVRVAENVGEY
jgi:hypothetical protein